jgi:hypothetical protein
MAPGHRRPSWLTLMQVPGTLRCLNFSLPTSLPFPFSLPSLSLVGFGVLIILYIYIYICMPCYELYNLSILYIYIFYYYN